jgi:hypothetical protein
MHPSKRRNLLIVCAGDQSLHTEWFETDRTFDILTIYYGAAADKADHYRRNSDLFFHTQGLKYELARKVLLHDLCFTRGFRFSDYRHIWFPDDDLRFEDGHQGLERLFAVANSTDADVFQPAIQNENFSLGWEATRLIPGLYAHRTNIVEIMVHGFSGQAFETCFLPALHLCDFMRAGWGLEPVWTKIGEARYRRALRTFVFDCCPIIHTRPVGGGTSNLHRVGEYETGYIPQIETNRMVILDRYDDLAALLAAAPLEIAPDIGAVEAFHAARFADFMRRYP